MTDSVMSDTGKNDHGTDELRRKQRRKNLAMLVILFGWAIMLYIVAILKMEVPHDRYGIKTAALLWYFAALLLA